MDIEMLLSLILDVERYQLKGLICHEGISLHSGHYHAFVNRNRIWYHMDDEMVIRLPGV